MNVVFLGFGTYGAASLTGLIESNDVNVDLVISHPQKPNDPESNTVLDIAKQHGIHTLQSAMLSETYIGESIVSAAPDAIVSTNWRRQIPERIFKLSKLGTVNIHDALLPSYGGLSAEQWVVLKGETKTGVTVHFVSEQMDAGPIILSEAFEIDNYDTAETISSKQLEIYPRIICKALSKISEEGFQPECRNPDEYVRYHSLSRRDAKLSFDKSPTEIARQMRAWSGKFGGCWLDVGETRYNLHEVEFPEISVAGIPGRVVTHTERGTWVATSPCTETKHSGVIIRKVEDPDGNLLDSRKVMWRGLQLGAG
ncbi:MAG: formyltransferase family protein [Litoreibacter sp.]